jgi:hypothetical protein
MMRMTDRRLVSIRRYVPGHRRDEYAVAWNTLHDAATSRGAHAWHFISLDETDVFLEFLEFGSEADVREDPATLEAIKALHEAFGGPYPPPRTIEEWAEVRPEREPR